MIHESEIQKLKKVTDEDKVKLVRALPWKLKKVAYKSIAKNGTEEIISSLIGALKFQIETNLEDSQKYKYERDLETFNKFLKKYKKI